MAKILIIDDANFTRTFLKRMVVKFGHEVIEATNGREGIEKVFSDKPDIVLIDMLMPEMDGVELLTLMRETHEDVPVIVVSANIQETMKEQCIGLGVSMFFGKPPNKEKLQEAIEKILNKEKQD